MARLTEMTNGKAIDADYAALNKQIAALKEDLASITATLGDLGKHQGQAVAANARTHADSLREMSAAQLTALRDQSAAQLEVLRSKAGTAATQADAFVKDRPATAVGIAAGVGFVLGLLTARR